METGDDYTCLMVEGRPVAGAFPPQMEGTPPHWDVYFNVEDCDATVARAVGLGASELVAPYDLPGVGRTATVRDPAGRARRLPPEPAGGPLDLRRRRGEHCRHDPRLVPTGSRCRVGRVRVLAVGSLTAGPASASTTVGATLRTPSAPATPASPTCRPPTRWARRTPSARPA